MYKWIDLFRVNKLFIKIFLSFLSLLIPVVLLGLITHANFLSESKREYSDKIDMQLAYSGSTIEQYWKTLYEAGANFYGDPAVRRLLKSATWTSAKSRADLGQLFDSMYRTRFDVDSIASDLFAYVDDKYVITSDGVTDFYAFFEKYRRYDGLNAKFWLHSLDSKESVEIIKPHKVTTAFQTTEQFSFVVRNLSGGNHSVLVADVPVDNIKRALSPVQMNGVTDVLVEDAAGDIVISTSGATTGYEALDRLFPKNGLEQRDEKEIRIGGRPYLASAYTMDTFGWTLYAITPVSEFNRQAKDILRLITGIGIALCLIGTVFALVFSLRIYKPIRRIAELYLAEDKRNRWLDDRPKQPDNLKAINDGIQQLVAFRDHYHDEWKMMALEFVDHALHPIVRGADRNKERDESIVRMMETHLSFTKSRYLCCVIALEFKQKFFEDIQDVERIVIESKMKNFIHGYLSQYAKMHVLETNAHYYVCIVNLEIEDEPQFRKGVAQFVRISEYDQEYYKLRIGIGPPREGLDGISQSYRGAMTALNSLHDGERSEVACGDWEDGPDTVHYTYADEFKLLKGLNFGKEEEVEQALADILDKRESSLYVQNSLISEIYGTANRFLAERGLRQSDLLNEQEKAALDGSSPLPREAEVVARRKTLLWYLQQIIARTCEGKTAYKSNTLAHTIKQFVEEHYTSDLHLEEISTQMGVSVKYVSRVFKEHFNTNLTDYISELRIQLAKELLADSSLTVQEISERVGFYNRTTFLRTFKKFEGKSPNQFRQGG